MHTKQAQEEASWLSGIMDYFNQNKGRMGGNFLLSMLPGLMYGMGRGGLGQGLMYGLGSGALGSGLGEYLDSDYLNKIFGMISGDPQSGAKGVASGGGGGSAPQSDVPATTPMSSPSQRQLVETAQKRRAAKTTPPVAGRTPQEQQYYKLKTMEDLNKEYQGEGSGKYGNYWDLVHRGSYDEIAALKQRMISDLGVKPQPNTPEYVQWAQKAKGVNRRIFDILDAKQKMGDKFNMQNMGHGSLMYKMNPKGQMASRYSEQVLPDSVAYQQMGRKAPEQMFLGTPGMKQQNTQIGTMNNPKFPTKKPLGR